MLLPTAKKKRCLEIIQFVLTFVSVCAVLETSRIHLPVDRPPGYYAGIPQGNVAADDRRLGDLARADRKRREAEQQLLRRGMKRGDAGASAAA